MENNKPTVKKIFEDYKTRLSGLYPDSEIGQFLYLLFEEYLGWTKPMIHMNLKYRMSGDLSTRFYSALKELNTGKPVQHILGKTWFNGLVLNVNKHVLIPRPETAVLCGMIKEHLAGLKEKPLRILDIGTGSGCIAIDLNKYFEKARVTALDISEPALETATLNASRNHAEIKFIHSDILNRNFWPQSDYYELIVSNPPYVCESEKIEMHPNVLSFDPAGALFVKDDKPLIFYEAIAAFAQQHLCKGGHLFFEINEKFGQEVKSLLITTGFNDVTLYQDIHGKDRFLKAISPGL